MKAPRAELCTGGAFTAFVGFWKLWRRYRLCRIHKSNKRVNRVANYVASWSIAFSLYNVFPWDRSEFCNQSIESFPLKYAEIAPNFRGLSSQPRNSPVIKSRQVGLTSLFNLSSPVRHEIEEVMQPGPFLASGNAPVVINPLQNSEGGANPNRSASDNNDCPVHVVVFWTLFFGILNGATILLLMSAAHKQGRKHEGL
jgi:hypothetical protein